jgi:hypothetical protein
MTPPSAARSYFKMQIDQFYGACRRHQRWKIATQGTETESIARLEGAGWKVAPGNATTIGRVLDVLEHKGVRGLSRTGFV